MNTATGDGFDAGQATQVIQNLYRHQLQQTTPEIESCLSWTGFSGAKIWKIMTSPSGVSRHFCLRRWPGSVGADESRLRWIHRQIAGLWQSGFRLVSVPVVNDEGETLSFYDDHLWQLEPWMPGQAMTADGFNDEYLKLAMQTIARLHAGLASQTGDRRESSSGLLMRYHRFSQLFANGAVTAAFGQIELAAERSAEGGAGWPELAESFRRICRCFARLAQIIEPELIHWIEQPVRVQPIAGDLWFDHLLFTGNEPTGVIDFGAMRMDTPAADVARFLGSLQCARTEQGDRDGASLSAGMDLIREDRARDEYHGESLVRRGIQLYRQAAGQIADDSKKLVNNSVWVGEYHGPDFDYRFVATYNYLTTLTAAINWVHWICVENRKFPCRDRVIDRVQMLVKRLDFLNAFL